MTGNGCPASTASKRPGTPCTEPIPAATASWGSPSSSPTATTPVRLARLKRPRSRLSISSGPRGVAMPAEMPVASPRASIGRTGAGASTA